MPSRLHEVILKYEKFEADSVFLLYGLLAFVVYYFWKSTELKNPSGLPVIGRRWYELGNGRARKRFRDDCLGLVRSCQKKVSDHSNMKLDFI